MSSEGKKAAQRANPQSVASLVARTFRLSDRIVQVRLEPSYWEGLDEICRREDVTAEELCADVQDRMEQQSRRSTGRTSAQPGVSLANALRVFVVGYFRQAATERGHARAGHGQGDPFVSTPFDITAVRSDT